MKKAALSIAVLLISLLGSANGLEAYFLYNVFASPEGSYIETSISTIGNSAKFVLNEKNEYQAKIEITMIFKQNNEVVTYKKYELKSPEMSDTAAAMPNFLDVQRIPLEPGTYNLELFIKDLNSPENEFQYYKILEIPDFSESLALSSIQFIEDYYKSSEESILTKNGIDMIPYVSDFFPDNMNRLIFYTELYNSKEAIGDDFLIKYFIENYESKKVLNSFARFKKSSPDEIIPILGQLNIEKLSSGNYNLVIQVLNKTNDVLLEKRSFFQRSKTIPLAEIDEVESFQIDQLFTGDLTNEGSLREFISSLRPISDKREKAFIDHQLANAEKKYMQRFFYQFWVKRAPNNPAEEWRIYKQQVEMVEKNYGTRIKKGYETDRGRIHLKYGTPDDLHHSEHEPSAYPYEIWFYYKADNERNKKFVFYNPDLAGNDYQLLHSDVTGELRTPNWERYLSKRNNTLYNQDLDFSDDQWGSRAREIYDQH